MCRAAVWKTMEYKIVWNTIGDGDAFCGVWMSVCVCGGGDGDGDGEEEMELQSPLDCHHLQQQSASSYSRLG